jgi:hypothetical protein
MKLLQNNICIHLPVGSIDRLIYQEVKVKISFNIKIHKYLHRFSLPKSRRKGRFWQDRLLPEVEIIDLGSFVYSPASTKCLNSHDN